MRSQGWTKALSEGTAGTVNQVIRPWVDLDGGGWRGEGVCEADDMLLFIQSHRE